MSKLESLKKEKKILNAKLQKLERKILEETQNTCKHEFLPIAWYTPNGNDYEALKCTKCSYTKDTKQLV